MWSSAGVHPVPVGSDSGLGYHGRSRGHVRAGCAGKGAPDLATLKDITRPVVYRSGGYGGVAQLVERLTGSQEVRGFESHRLHSKSQVRRLFWSGIRRVWAQM